TGIPLGAHLALPGRVARAMPSCSEGERCLGFVRGWLFRPGLLAVSGWREGSAGEAPGTGLDSGTAGRRGGDSLERMLSRAPHPAGLVSLPSQPIGIAWGVPRDGLFHALEPLSQRSNVRGTAGVSVVR